jgi:hypothetical protein
VSGARHTDQIALRGRRHGAALAVVMAWLAALPAGRADVAAEAIAARGWVGRPAERTVLATAGGVLSITELHYATPRPLRAWVVELDPAAPGVRFALTEPQRFRGEEARFETRCATTLEFARQRGTVVAINTSAFGPFRAAVGEPMDVVGLAAVRGRVYSEPHDPYGALHIDADGRVRLQGPPLDRANMWHAVPGFCLLLAGQRVVVAEERAASSFGGVNPRTAVGVDRAGRRLWLVVVDGRQPGVSEGITLVELACLLEWLGAWDALNLDGGGSTTLVLEQPDATHAVLNTPVGRGAPGTLRQVANNLGVYLPDGVAGMLHRAPVVEDGPRARLGRAVAGHRRAGAVPAAPELRAGDVTVPLPGSADSAAARATLHVVVGALAPTAPTTAAPTGSTQPAGLSPDAVRSLGAAWFAPDGNAPRSPAALVELAGAVPVADPHLFERGDIVAVRCPQEPDYVGVFWARHVDDDGRTRLLCWPPLAEASAGTPGAQGGLAAFTLAEGDAAERITAVRLAGRAAE